jgi:uncharacterized protein YodC (DUF2158 family)
MGLWLGMIVTLKSGRPDMTIVAIMETMERPWIRCGWFDDKLKYHKADFHRESLNIKEQS